MSLAQIGEFAFVLLSRASNLHLVEVRNFRCMHFVFSTLSERVTLIASLLMKFCGSALVFHLVHLCWAYCPIHFVEKFVL